MHKTSGYKFSGYLFLLTMFLWVSGCGGEAVNYAPVPKELLPQVKNNWTVEQTDELLGTHHELTSEQRATLEQFLSKMPEHIRGNAEADRHLAWGDNQNFLIGVVNEDDVLWATTFRHK